MAVVPSGPLGYLTVWPTGRPQPLVATLNSVDGRVKSNAAIVPAGTSGAISVTPCRIADTRWANAPLGGPYLAGGTQQFTAAVTGSSDTAVTWSATGGSVSASGLYTAPSTTGGFTVKATSVADNTRSASASVIVSVTVQHTVTLTWTASTSTVSGYNVYRGTLSGGPYTLLSLLETNTTYSDVTVQSGQTYFYVATAVDASAVESAYSNEAVAVVPFP